MSESKSVNTDLKNSAFQTERMSAGFSDQSVKSETTSHSVVLLDSTDLSNQAFHSIRDLLATDFSYHELSTSPLQSLSPLEMLRKNIQSLEDLQSKHGFMMREISYMLRADS